MKLYHYTLHDVGYEDTGHIIAENEEDAKEKVWEIADEDYLAVFVSEVKVGGYIISVVPSKL